MKYFSKSVSQNTPKFANKVLKTSDLKFKPNNKINFSFDLLTHYGTNFPLLSINKLGQIINSKQLLLDKISFFYQGNFMIFFPF